MMKRDCHHETVLLQEGVFKCVLWRWSVSDVSLERRATRAVVLDRLKTVRLRKNPVVVRLRFGACRHRPC